MPGVAAVIPAGGAGTRIGGTPKQFRRFRGRPMVDHTVEAFARWRPECGIVVVVPAEEEERFGESLTRRPVQPLVTTGGLTRQASVLNGLRALAGRLADDDVVLIHDAVRPFVSIELIDRVFRSAVESGAGAPAIPVVDTLRRVSDGSFGDTVSREGLFRMQTPQAFRFGEILRAHEAAAGEGFEATDDVALFLRSGRTVAFVQGDETNIKVTTQRDLDAVGEALG